MGDEAKFYNGVDLGGQKGVNAAPGVNPTDLVTVSQLGATGVDEGLVFFMAGAL